MTKCQICKDTILDIEICTCGYHISIMENKGKLLEYLDKPIICIHCCGYELT